MSREAALTKDFFGVNSPGSYISTMKLEELLPKVKENISLKEYTTFKIGGNARYFLIAETKDDVISAIKTAKEIKLPFFIIGGGSNLLFSDKGFKGLIIKLKNSKIERSDNSIYCEAGAKINDLSSFALKESLSNLEWAFGIPGTLGGAIYGNAQAFGERISNIVESVEAFDAREEVIKRFSNEECCFSLKNSVFKQNKNLIILSAILIMRDGNAKEMQEKMQEHLKHRQNNHPLNFPSAGSVFINTEVKIKNEKMLKDFPEFSVFNNKGFIPSSYLIEKCGLKGKKIGGAQISERHANFIVNLGDAKAKDVIRLIKLVKTKVKKIFKIDLDVEIQIIS